MAPEWLAVTMCLAVAFVMVGLTLVIIITTIDDIRKNR